MALSYSHGCQWSFQPTLKRRGDTPRRMDELSLYRLAATAHHPVARYDPADSGYFYACLRGRDYSVISVRFPDPCLRHLYRRNNAISLL